jgi:radical SAM protein (TIGR01212 family)
MTLFVHELGPILKKKYGKAVRKICLRIGATCPTRDGTSSELGCAFCAEEETPAPLSIREQMEIGIRRMGPHTPVIAYLQDHTVTYLAAERLGEILEAIRCFPQVVEITLGTRPDCLFESILRVLARYTSEIELLVELGLQSANDQTLALVNRQHTVKDVEQATERLHRIGARVCAHVILGLPTPCIKRSASGLMLQLEGEAHVIATADLIAQTGIEAVKIHNCHVLEGSLLADWYRDGRYKPPQLEEYISLLEVFLLHLPSTVEVHRLMAEARPPFLIAPSFTADKNRSLHRIRAALSAKNLSQGSAEK